MEIVLSNDDFTVIDNVFDSVTFDRIWHSVQALRYDFPDSEWLRLWSLSDPQPVKSGPFRWSERPCGHGMDEYINKFMEVVNSTENCLSKAELWTDIAFRVYLHGRGSKMVAHSDAPKFVGAGVFYVHPAWKAVWGGELCFPSVPSDVIVENISILGDSLTNERVLAAVEQRGFGVHVMPRPNRLVLIRGGVVHSTNRVDSDAGAALRCSITSFFIPTDNKWNFSARETISLD